MHVLVLFGGASPEHPISLRSAAAVLRSLEATSHQVTTIGITREGYWRVGDFSADLAQAERQIVELSPDAGTAVALVADAEGARLIATATSPEDGGPAPPIPTDTVDVVFPVLHGPRGEDGTVQGYLEMLGIPFVGAGCCASALAMDKVAMKTLCDGANIPQVEFLSAGTDDEATLRSRVEAAFGYPCFVKPANLGSSVGVSCAKNAEELASAVSVARSYDPRVVIERGVDAREVEVALLGHAPLEISPPGEILPTEGFYDFEGKYVDGDAAGLQAPADVAPEILEQIHEVSRKAWELIGGRGMARADFFVSRDGANVWLNEINTIPGFTEISMYPRLWAEAGMNMTELVENLLALAVAD